MLLTTARVLMVRIPQVQEIFVRDKSKFGIYLSGCEILSAYLEEEKTGRIKRDIEVPLVDGKIF